MIKLKHAAYRMFDYERLLCEREVQRLSGTVVESDSEGLTVIGGPPEFDTTGVAQRLIDRSTYLAAVRTPDTRWQPTQQAHAEETHWRLRGGASRRRQSTRFGIHGVHEYRGKFNPQVARALINVVDPEATALLDPFCGSGTTLIEGLRLGMTVAGIDLSPIGHHVATVKTKTALFHDHQELLRDLQGLCPRVSAAIKEAQDEAAFDGNQPLCSDALQYLTNWFTVPALAALLAGLSAINEHDHECSQLLARLALSSILRDVSLQVPEDLRVRRRPPGFVAPSLAELFVSACERVEYGLEELIESPNIRGSSQVLLGSTHDHRVLARLHSNSMKRLIVTSPPYATALPYIDTDRLSLVALGLAQPADLRSLEASLVGSREWDRASEKSWTEARASNAHALPTSVTHLLDELDERNRATSAGFRRAAVPTLLYRYFAQMRSALHAWSSNYLRTGESAVLVVGRNRTGAASDRIVIDTPQLLSDIAEHQGFTVSEIIPFETWPRYGLHSSNGVSGEDALVLHRI